MTETIQTTSGTNRTTGPDRGLGKRGLGFVGLLLLGLGLIVAIEQRSLRQVSRLEQTLAEASPGSFRLGLRLREGLEQLCASLLRFGLSRDETERSRFHTTARDLSGQLAQAGPSLLTPAEREIAQSAAAALDTFLEASAPLLTEERRAIRRDTAAELNAEIRERSALVFERADRLVAVQEESAARFFAEVQEALRSLRHWLLGSLFLFLVLLAAVIALSYRVLVTPLRLRLTESQAIIDRQERLASLGVLTAGVAHEIRNPLAAIKFRLYSLQRSLPASVSQEEDLGIIDHEIQRLDRIVRDLLQFARPSEPEFKTVPILPLLEAMRDLLQADLDRRGVRLDVVEGEPLSVRADRQQLQQVLINLIQNAAEATPAGGTITLSARAGAARRIRRVEPVVMVEVKDSGRGLTPEIGRRIFDPFFSTKEGGTGLGLPLAARIVELHGGFLQYTSQPQRGSTFTVVLPKETDEPG